MQQQETQRDDVQHYDNRIGAEVQKPLVGIPARANGAQYQHQIENRQIPVFVLTPVRAGG